MQIAKNTVVSISYALLDAQGGLLEKSDEPVSYLHGGYDGIFPLVEEALHGKNTGDSCAVYLEPENAFGEYESDLVRIEPQSLFPADLAVGMRFEGQAEDSDEVLIYTVTDIAEGKVVVDANHPLAGQALNFSCTVVAVRPATNEEIMHGHVHGEDEHHH